MVLFSCFLSSVLFLIQSASFLFHIDFSLFVLLTRALLMSFEEGFYFDLVLFHQGTEGLLCKKSLEPNLNNNKKNRCSDSKPKQSIEDKKIGQKPAKSQTSCWISGSYISYSNKDPFSWLPFHVLGATWNRTQVQRKCGQNQKMKRNRETLQQHFIH